MNTIIDIEHSINNEYSCLMEIAEKMGVPNRPDLGYRALKSVLHVVRDMLFLHEVFYFSNLLPFFIRGIFFEGYNWKNLPVVIYNQELLRNLKNRLGPRNSIYFENYLRENQPEKIGKEEFFHRIHDGMGFNNGRIEPQDAFFAVLEVLDKRLPASEWKSVRSLMDKNVPELLAFQDKHVPDRNSGSFIN